MDEAKKSFKPEFLNRLTEIVIFRSLAKESMSSIVDLELNKVSQRLKDKKLKIEPDPVGIDGERLVFPRAEVKLLAPVPRPGSFRDFSIYETHMSKADVPFK